MAFVIAADAPHAAPSFELIGTVWSEVGRPGALSVLGIALALSLAIQPLQYRLVQILEGYWPWRIADRIADWLTGRQQRKRAELVKQLTPDGQVPTPSESARMSLAEDNLRMRTANSVTRPTSRREEQLGVGAIKRTSVRHRLD